MVQSQKVKKGPGGEGSEEFWGWMAAVGPRGITPCQWHLVWTMAARMRQHDSLGPKRKRSFTTESLWCLQTITKFQQLTQCFQLPWPVTRGTIVYN